MKRLKCKRIKNAVFIIITLSLISVLYIPLAFAAPVNPAITVTSNSTISAASAGFELNNTGGYLYVTNITGTAQNSRWKAYVGNITGTLVLQDSNDYKIYDWSGTSSVTGEVFATRASGAINWSGLSCAGANATAQEEILINHTGNPNDNISSTFTTPDNNGFTVGTVTITANSCNTTNLYVNGTAGLNDDWEEVVLYDNINEYNWSIATFKNIVYASIIEEDAQSYVTNNTYDFQIILPENGQSGWSSATAYYFYVEIQ